ncbi:hypothetical protein CASFOL_018566 [Castilleja foliolosa]|uniref:C2H2-type domain-containing protein n=1 Tax=Castilleja foliolosa TaxID=1961234 RepID=A0ABD3D5Q1_9LAMI
MEQICLKDHDYSGIDQKWYRKSELEGHEVHLCRRCGWPFPNPHPSAKHRRAHKKHCGTIEGYTIILSEEHVSYNDHASDEDEHTPSNPKAVNKTAEDFGSSGVVGARSNKSEDDVFSDAVTDFSDSGISPRLEERFESVRELDNILEQKRLEAHLNGNETINVDTTAVAFEAYHVVKGLRSNTLSKPKWVYPKCCNDDVGDADCGLFVMRHMLEIIKLDVCNSFEKVLSMEEPYSSDDIDDVRKRWVECFLEVI